MLSIAIVNLKCEWTIRKNWSWFILFLESKDQMILLGQTDKCGTTSQKCATFWCQNISEGCSRCIGKGALPSTCAHVSLTHCCCAHASLTHCCCAHVSLTHCCFVLTAPPVLGEVSPSFLIQKEGDTIDMFCEASATPEPSLTWYKDGKVSNASSLNFRVNVSVFGALKNSGCFLTVTESCLQHNWTNFKE